jgi:hypothetical protein
LQKEAPAVTIVAAGAAAAFYSCFIVCFLSVLMSSLRSVCILFQLQEPAKASLNAGEKNKHCMKKSMTRGSD